LTQRQSFTLIAEMWALQFHTVKKLL